MKPRHILFAGLILLLAQAAWAQPTGTQDIRGTWSLTANAYLPQVEGAVKPAGEFIPEPNCFFSGTAVVSSQQGSNFSGNASLTLDSGAGGCPAELFANIQGTVSGNTIEMAMLMGGDLGDGTFSGTISSQTQAQTGGQSQTKAAQAAPPGRSINGNFAIQAGPFMGVSGGWAGALRSSLEGIPTLGNLGLLALALLLAGVGWAALARTKKAA